MLLAVTGYSLFSRADIETTILRTPGLMYQVTADHFISNLYNIKIVNKTREEIPVGLKLKSPQGRIKLVGGNLLIPGDQLIESAFFIEIPAKNIKFSRIPVFVEIFSGKELLDEIKTSFIGPDTNK
jgi:hypothetical protein